MILEIGVKDFLTLKICLAFFHKCHVIKLSEANVTSKTCVVIMVSKTDQYVSHEIYSWPGGTTIMDMNTNQAKTIVVVHAIYHE